MLAPSTSNDWIATVVATAAGLTGILVASRIWAHGPHGRPCACRHARASCRAQVLLGRALRLRLLPCRPLALGRPAPHARRAAALLLAARRARLRRPSAARPRASPRADGPRARLRAALRARRRRPRLLLHGAGRLMFDVYTVNATTLIVFPLIVGGAGRDPAAPARGPRAGRAWRRRCCRSTGCCTTIIPDLADRRLVRVRDRQGLADRPRRPLPRRHRRAVAGDGLHDRARGDLRDRLRGLGGPVPRPRRTSRCCCCSSRR